MKQFRLLKPGTDEDVLGGPISEGNAYIRAYPKVLGKPIADLAVWESTLAEYSLSGSKSTYRILRIEDKES